MKKFLLTVAILSSIFSLSACHPSNKQMFVTTWSFRWVIIQLGNGELIEGTVESWKDFGNSDVVQFTVNGVTYLTHYSNVILCTEKP